MAASWMVNYIGEPVMTFVVKLDTSPQVPASETLLIAYDDEYSIDYFGTHLRPWWRRGGDTDAASMLRLAADQQETVLARAREFDETLRRRATACSGEAYTRLLALCYRQAMAAHKLVEGPAGQPLFFSKENLSNGCIATVDVTYPSAPLFLALNPALLRAMLDPIFEYCASDAWPHPFPAHDLGVYPKATGQVYAGDRRSADIHDLDVQMPVEEAGNMLILTAALAHRDGDPGYASRHWALLSQWTDYLVGVGFNPGEQLCTDDFTGQLAGNTNLSVKAILGVACYARLALLQGLSQTAERYRAIAVGMAEQWIAAVSSDLDGTPSGTRLAFDRPGTWSQKYNLVWDRLLGLDIFPEDVRRREQASYAARMKTYGLPLDSRTDLTMPQWQLWAASLVHDPVFFEDLADRILLYTDTTRVRVPFSDLYRTSNAQSIGFRARSVPAGVFIALLEP